MIVAVDTGGTKTLVATLSSDGVIETAVRFATPKDTDEYISTLVDTIKKQNPDGHITAIVIAVPGTVRDGILIRCGNLPWENFPVKTRLTRHFPKIPVFVENDANLGGLGEVRERKNPPPRCLYVTISTGIGGGFIVDGDIDPTMRDAEIGLMRLEFDDEVVKWEEIASGKALSNAYHTLAEDLTDKRNWRAVANRISRGFLAFLPVLNPDLVIIGGSVGAHFENFSEYLLTDVKKRLPSYFVCPIVKAKHPEKAVIYGCYHYAINHPRH